MTGAASHSQHQAGCCPKLPRHGHEVKSGNYRFVFNRDPCQIGLSDQIETTKEYGAVCQKGFSSVTTTGSSDPNELHPEKRNKKDGIISDKLDPKSGQLELLSAGNFRPEHSNGGCVENKDNKDDTHAPIPIPIPEDIVSPWRTCIVLCLAYIFTYSAFGAISNLESSLNSQHQLGMVSLAVIYANFIIGSLISPVLARVIGHKNIMVLNFVVHLCYTGANFKPTRSTLLPVSALFGVIVGTNAMSKGVYIAAISTSYIHTRQLSEAKLYGVMSFFYGLFYFSFKATYVTGNLLSSGILQAVSPNRSAYLDNQCGATVCSSSRNSSEYEKPSNHVLNILFGSFTLCDIVGLAIIAVGLPYLRKVSNESTKKQIQWQELNKHLGGCLSALVQPKMLILIPSVMAQSMVTMVMQAGYTRDFVTCSAGVQWVGYCMVALGVTSSMVALVLGLCSLARYTGRVTQFVMGMGADLSSIVIMLAWNPDNRTSPAVLLVVPMLAGVAQGTLQPQQQALIGSLFSKEELPSALAALNCVKSVAYVVCLCVDATTCLHHGLVIALVMYVPGVAGYVYTEFREWKAEQQAVSNGTTETVIGTVK